MIIFLVGISCVGKSTIGEQLTKRLKYRFYDLDKEVEHFYRKPIGRLKSEWLFAHTFRQNASKVLVKIIENNKEKKLVIALPPSGLYTPYPQIIKKSGGVVIVLKDSPKNILSRIVFFDDDSRQIEKKLTAKEKKLYLKAIRDDIDYFRRSYKKADYFVNLDGLGISESVKKVYDFLVQQQLI